jgi:hypothetical protein
MRWLIAGGNGLEGSGKQLSFPSDFISGLHRVLDDPTNFCHFQVFTSKNVVVQRDSSGGIMKTCKVTLYGYRKIITHFDDKGVPNVVASSLAKATHTTGGVGEESDGKDATPTDDASRAAWIHEVNSTYGIDGITIASDPHDHTNTGIRFDGIAAHASTTTS